MNEQDKLIEEQLKTLPQDLRQAINSVPWKNLVQEIGKQNNLKPEQISSLEQETMLIIYGFVNPGEYSTNLAREIGIDEIAAENLASSIWDKVMEPISQKVVNKEAVAIETPSANLPMVEPGEIVHEVSHVESGIKSSTIPEANNQPKVSLPDYRYPDGKDPYRELPT